MPIPESSSLSLLDDALEHLARGAMPWRAAGSAASHANLVTKQPYLAVNQLLLRKAARERGYASPWWITASQAQARRGRILAAEVERPVAVHAVTRALGSRSAPAGDPDPSRPRSVVLLYNYEQTAGLGRLVPPPPNLDFWEPDEAACIAAAWKDAPPLFPHPGTPVYQPMRDRIGMPRRQDFADRDEYHATLFHEYVHATGHPSRCARFSVHGPEGGEDGEALAFEELVAELGTLFLCGVARIRPRGLQDNGPCLAAWREMLAADSGCLAEAARLGQEAADWILGQGRDR